MNIAHRQVGRAGTDNTSVLAFGGVPPPAGITNTEEWDGTSWTEVADLNSAQRSQGSSGTATAALSAGGGVPVVNTTQEWTGATVVPTTFTDS
jgi:hypothetical protein